MTDMRWHMLKNKKGRETRDLLSITLLSPYSDEQALSHT